MKTEKFSTGDTIMSAIHWQPTIGLRQKREEIYVNGVYDDTITILQQLWQCSNGKQEWRDVPTVD